MTGHTDTAQIAAAGGTRMRTRQRGARGTSALLARAAAVLLALFFVAHGVAHAVGITAIFGLRGDAGNTSTLLAFLDPTSIAYRALGVVWVVALGLFVVAAAGLVLRKSWWLVTAFSAAIVSLALCIVWYDSAIVGLVVNAAILVGLAIYTVVRRRAAR